MTIARYVAPVSGPDPTADEHLATKSYVDSRGLGGLKARDVGPLTNVTISSSGTASTTVLPPGSAPTDGTVWTWLPSGSNAWRSVPAVTGDLVVYQLRALLGNGTGSSSVEGNFSVVIMDAATSTPKRWVDAAPGTPLVPSQWGPADMQFFDARWNVNTLPPVAITVGSSDVSADGNIHVTLGYKPLASGGFNLEGTTADPGMAWLLNYGSGTFASEPVPSHSALSGLGNDDHTQYHNDTRGDARYPLLTSKGAANGIASLDSSALVPIAQIPTGSTSTTVPLGNHNHAHNSLTGLTTGDPHTQYHNDTRGDARYPLLTSKGAANGIASLDASTKIPIAQVPTGTTSTTVSLGNHTHAHSALTGLSNDDHTQYHNDTRGDARYPLLSSKGAANGIASLDSGTKIPIAQVPTGTTSTTVSLGNHTHTLLPVTATSGSRPAGSTGLIIHETDTDDTYVYGVDATWHFLTGKPRVWQWDRTTTSVVSGTDTRIVWTAKTTTTNVTNTGDYRVTPGRAGRFYTRASIRFGSGGTGGTEAFVGIRHYNSGGTLLEVVACGVANASSGVANLAASGEITVAATDYLEVWVYQASGTAKTPEDGPFVNSGYTRFEGRFISA